MDLISNYFYENRGFNGGALYLINDALSNKNTKDKVNKGANSVINVKNNIFDNNFADNYGGGIYSEFDQFYMANSKNNTIKNNSAGTMGGGIYSPESFNKNVFNIKEDCIFFNNTVSYHDSNYATRPSILSLDTAIENIKIFTGDYLPLEFTVHDEFGDKIEDVYNNYSTITMVISMYEKDEYIENYYLDQKRHENNNIMFSVLSMHIKYNLLGNIGTFKHGKFELKYLQIFAKPGNYVLNVEIENYNYKLKFDFKKIEIEVLGCNENQITMYNHYNIEYCEKPICHSDCPITKSAICKPFYNTSINDPDKNKCVCLPGWSGKLCENHIWVEFK